MANQRQLVVLFTTFLALFILTVNVDAQSTQCPARMPGLPSSHRNHLRAKQQTDERIVDGNEAKPNSYPWMVYLQIKFWNDETATCGGTLISADWILTAAHCTNGAVSIVAVMGAHDITAQSNDQHQVSFTITPQNVISYPGWYIGKVEDDVSLLRLPQSVPISEYISAARLPYSDDPDQDNDSVILLGWGNFSSTLNSGLSPKLREVATNVIDYSVCQRNSNVGSFTDEKIICGDGSDGRRYCYGDDGGPMADYREDESQWFVIGVAWFGDKTVECQSSRLPNIYARVSYYSDWIQKETGIPPVDRPTTTTSTTTTTTTTTTSTTTTTTRPTTTKDPYAMDCTGKPNGLYPAPGLTCTKYFYYCANETPYLYECPVADTVFYYAICNCEFPELVPECNTN